MSEAATETRAKFRDPDWTATGERRARVALDELRTLWINTGSLCNIECRNCYIESSPTNDRLVYITAREVSRFYEEIAATRLPVKEIGFTGGEPFMNPDIIPMMEDALARGFSVLILTNAMQPMVRPRVLAGLLALRDSHRDQLTLRVSLDHYTKERHEEERGPGTFDSTIAGIDWLSCAGFKIALAGRTCWGESEADARKGYAARIKARGWPFISRAVSGNGCARRATRDHGILLGHSRQAAVTVDVRVEPHGREAEGRRPAGGTALHVTALRSRLRDGRDVVGSLPRGRRHVRPRRGQALPSLLRRVLRARRRQLFGLKLSPA
jgi:hypothetical protein